MVHHSNCSTLCNAALLLDKRLLLLYLLLLLLEAPAVVAEGSLHALIRGSEAFLDRKVEKILQSWQ